MSVPDVDLGDHSQTFVWEPQVIHTKMPGFQGNVCGESKRGPYCQVALMQSRTRSTGIHLFWSINWFLISW